MAAGDEVRRVGDLDRRLQDGDLEVEQRQLALVHGQEPRVVEGGGRGGLAHVDPERHLEAQQADAAAQFAALVDRDEGGPGLDERRGRPERLDRVVGAVTDGRFDRGAGEGEERQLVGTVELLRGGPRCCWSVRGLPRQPGPRQSRMEQSRRDQLSPPRRIGRARSFGTLRGERPEDNRHERHDTPNPRPTTLQPGRPAMLGVAEPGVNMIISSFSLFSARFLFSSTRN